MAIPTLMVNVDLQGGDDAALRLAGELAGRFGSRVIGVGGSNQAVSAFNHKSLPLLT